MALIDTVKRDKGGEKPPTRYYSKKQEDAVAKKFGGSRVKNSGATKFAKGDNNKETLLRLSSEEEAHAKVWQSYTNEDVKPNKLKIFKYTI